MADAKTIPVKMEVHESGKLIEVRDAHFTIMRPLNPNACQECAREHDPEQPHDAQSIHYHYVFYGKHGRWPTWADALAHCPDEVRQVWEAELRRMKAWTEPDKEPHPNVQ